MSRAKIKPLQSIQIQPLGDFGGAVKVCARYGPGQFSGKTRCLQWMSGPGYAEGPAERGNGTTNPQYFVQAARVRPDGSPLRQYRYRSGNRPLPYPPRTLLDRGGKTVFNPASGRTQALWDDLPQDVQIQILKVVNEGALKPLQPHEELLIPAQAVRTTAVQAKTVQAKTVQVAPVKVKVKKLPPPTTPAPASPKTE